MINVVSLGHATVVSVGDVMCGSRLGREHQGLDACWCNPSCFMGVANIEINVSWS